MVCKPMITALLVMDFILNPLSCAMRRIGIILLKEMHFKDFTLNIYMGLNIIKR